MRDAALCLTPPNDADEIYHLAAQVAVTTSVDHPRPDFEVNALGTFNVLEAAPKNPVKRPFSSLHLDQQGLRRPARRPGRGPRHALSRRRLHASAVSDELTHRSTSTHRTAASKGAADQYVRDYARIYSLPTVVFRMSCIAGPRQFGNEDQGWVAHFLYTASSKAGPSPSTATAIRCVTCSTLQICIDAMQAANTHIASQPPGTDLQRRRRTSISAISVREMLAEIASESSVAVRTLRYSSVRPGDQPLYISDTSEALASYRLAPGSLHARHPQRSIHQFWHSNRSPAP